MAWLHSRREFLAAIGFVFAPERRRYADPATELEVIRLTDPAFASGMTAPHLRQFNRHSEFLLCWSDRATGSRQAFFTNLKTGESEQLSEAAELDPTSLTLTPDEKSFLFFDGPALFESPVVKPSPRQIYRVPDGSTRAGFTIAADSSVYFGERTGDRTRIMRIAFTPKGPQPHRAFDLEGEITDLMARPGNLKTRFQLLYRQGGALWVAGSDGSNRRLLKLESGQTGHALWIPSGRTIVYLHIPENPKELITFREHTPETGADALLSKTSQFISATPNADASVFAAASRSVASPYVLIMLRAARRELTLCEHHASDAAMVNPVFTPDSKTVLFVSDRHGKSAIYLMTVAKFVEETPVD